MKLKKSHIKLITRLYVSAKQNGLDLPELFKNMFNEKVVSVDDAAVAEFRGTLSGVDVGIFDERPLEVQKSIVARIKEQENKLSVVVELADKLFYSYEALEKDIDAIAKASLDCDQDYIDNLVIDEYFAAVVKIIQENLSFFTGLQSQINGKG